MATNQVLEKSVKKNGSAGKVADKKLDQNSDIEKLAYQYFVDRGCLHGFDREDWLKAEAVIRQRKG